MILLRFLLLFLILLTSTSSSFKLDDVMKKVGKRFTMNSYGLSYGNPFKRNFVLYRKRIAIEKKGVEQEKMKQAEILGEFLIQQQVVTEYSGELANRVGEMFSPTMTATYCNTDKELNLMQFRDYLFQQRKQFDQNSQPQDIIYRVVKERVDHLHFMMNFDQKTVFGTTTTVSFEVLAELQPEDVNGFDYLVYKVSIGGDCFSRGDANGPDYSFQDEMKNNTEVAKLFSLVVRERIKHAWEKVYRLPTAWLSSLDPSEDSFTARLCSGDISNPSLTNSSDVVYNWISIFALHWFINIEDESFVNGQVIEYVEKEKMILRFTNLLQRGQLPTTKEERREWEFIFKAEYNKKGDNLWYITQVDIPCPLDYDIIEEYWKASSTFAIERLVAAIRGKKAPEWYDSIYAVMPFIREGKTKFEVCQKGGSKKTSTNLRQLEVLFRGTCPYDAKVTGYYELEHKPRLTDRFKTSLNMEIALEPRNETVSGASYMAEWRFDLEWDPKLMYYWYPKVYFGCLSTVSTEQLDRLRRTFPRYG